jgi:phage tail sheath protein FI
VLGGLFERGAFAGRTPDESFRVLAGADLNPPAGIDAGRFVTQILVAPSEPAEFLSVRVIRAADGALQAGGA